MKKMFRKSLALLLALMMLATCLLAGCGDGKKDGEGEKKTVAFGVKGDIPFVSVDWEFQTGNQITFDYEQVGPGYGTVEKRTVAENVPIENWDFGDGVYQNSYKNVTPAMYQELVKTLKDSGYTVYSEGDINGDCFYTTLTYKSYVYNISYFANTQLAYINGSPERPLSPYLLQDNVSTQSTAIEGKVATLTMLPWQEGGGDNYIIQLSNGHYLLFDGGSHFMTVEVLKFLEENAPEGQIPVVDAWFVTHGHYDHVGWTKAFYGTYDQLNGLLYFGEAANRIKVNGIYWNQTNSDVIEHTIYGWRSDGFRNKNQNAWPYAIEDAAFNMYTEDGGQTPIYRPQAGQTYYFKDLTVEIPYCQEQIIHDEYAMDLNASSTWYVVRANDKVFLDGGDAEYMNMDYVRTAYSSNYGAFAGNVDIMNAFHHGHNIYDQHIDVFHAPIVFYTSKEMFKWAAEYTAANRKMMEEYGVEYYNYGTGGYQYSFGTGEVTKIK